jgi:prolyl-tRNA synthetase
MRQAYENIFRRCNVRTVAVAADTGVMGGAASHEFMLLSEAGEDTLVMCPNCGYAANAERATFRKPTAPTADPAPLRELATPDCKTIQQVADFLGVPTQQTLKVVLFTTANHEVIMALIRGDLEVNPVKLANALGGAELQPSTEEELVAAGIVPGYASPVGRCGLHVAADEDITCGGNFVAGANKRGYHFINVNYPRDLTVSTLTDIALAHAGDLCSACGSPLETARGIELGHLFKLGTRYAEALGASYLDQEGQAHPVVMGSYGIGSGRLMAAIIEENHDEHGIIWPAEVAPYQLHLLSIAADSADVAESADRLYANLTDSGYEVLYDDRAERAGVKFNDADLIGIPWRATVSPKTLSLDSVELKKRSAEERHMVPLPDLEVMLRQALGVMI